jgi:HK97 family phage portal protein
MRGIFGSIADVLETKSDVSYGTLDLWREIFGGAAVKSNVTVNIQTMLQTTTVLGCARRICEALTVPRKLYQKDRVTKSREEAQDHTLFDLISDEPNSLQDGYGYFETIGLHLSLCFNHYSLIGRVDGKIDELIPIEPMRVTPKLGNDYRMKYNVQLLDGTYVTFDQEDIWHIRGPSWNGAVGMDAVKLLREAVGLAIATEETHARLHSNGGQPGGILTSDKELLQPARDRLKEMWAQGYQGVANKFRTLVLDNGLKWQSMMMTGVDAQHIQLRQFQVEEICRGFGVMPIMVGYSGDKAPTFASSEQLFLAHLVHTVRPWQGRVASSIKRWLLTKEERKAGYYMRFVDADFIAPDMKSKAEFNKIALGGGGNPGWRTPNMVSADDEGPQFLGGDRLYVPVNVTPIGDDGWPRPVARDPKSKPGEA